MSCISSNFSSFFLDSLNDPSEFAKYLSNGENKFSPFEDFQVFGGTGGGVGYNMQQQQQQHFNGVGGGSSSNGVLPPYYNSSNNNVLHGSSSIGVAAAAGTATTSAGGHSSHNNSEMYNNSSIEANNFNQQQQTQQQQQHQHSHPPPSTQQQQQPYIGHSQQHQTTNFHNNNQQLPPLPPQHPLHLHPHQQHPAANTAAAGYASGSPAPIQRWSNSTQQHAGAAATQLHPNPPSNAAGAQHFDGSFEFLKYLRHSNDYSSSSSVGGSSSNHSDATANDGSNGVPISTAAANTPPPAAVASLIDLDTSTSMKPRSARKAAALLSSATRAVAVSALAADNTLDVFDHDDSKHTIFDLQHHITNGVCGVGSNSNESMDVSNLAFPNSHLNASNSNTSSEGAAAGSSDFANLNAAKPLVNFTIKENFDVHPSHKVEEGIFQHMNKLPSKKKENLKQLGVRFTGQMTLADKSIVVENFIKFCQEYEITDHRPFLSLNQSGLNKPEQIKLARYLGQGLPSFTLFCIYSNFKNLFCTKRTEIYTKDGYNLPYILDKTKRFLSNTTADLKNISQQQSNDGLDCITAANNNQSIATAELAKCMMPKVLENFMIYENFDVHDTHRVEDGVCTHITRLPPKKQEILKQFGIQSNQSVTYYEKYILVENFIKFCNEYKISDHRPFLDFHESGLPKPEQVKFVRFLGQGLPNLTLNKIYLAFRDVLGLNRIEKITIDGYNLDTILKKKKKNLYNRMHAAVPI